MTGDIPWSIIDAAVEFRSGIPMNDEAPELDEAERFSLEGGVLRCPEDMNRVSPRDLRDWCDKLLASDAAELAMDLTRTRYMASHDLGVISEAWSRALASERELVIRISADLHRLFELSGFDQFFKVVEGGGE